MARRQYICLDCIEIAAGSPPRSLPVDVFNGFRSEMAFSSSDGKCPTCGGSNTTKILSIEAAYVKGYGYADKKGTRLDMDLHAMVHNRDPYKDHRKDGEAKEVIKKLQRGKERDTHKKVIYAQKSNGSPY